MRLENKELFLRGRMVGKSWRVFFDEERVDVISKTPSLFETRASANHVTCLIYLSNPSQEIIFNCSVRNFIPLSEARLVSGLSSADKCEVIGVNHVKSSSLSIITY